MKYSRHLLTLLTAVVLLGAGVLPAGAAEPFPFNEEHFVPLEAVETGMDAHTLTVLQGTEIVRIPTEVIAVVPAYGFSNRAMIVTRMRGAAMDITNGSAGGMSGSPVVTGDGRLIGAHSGGWNFTSGRYGIVTPVDQMLDTFDPADPRFTRPFDPVPVNQGFDTSGLQLSPPPEYELADAGGTGSFAPGETVRLREPLELAGHSFDRVRFTSGADTAIEPGPAGDGDTLVVEYAAPPVVTRGPDPAASERFAELLDRFLGGVFSAGPPVEKIAERFNPENDGRTPQPEVPAGGFVPGGLHPGNVEGPQVMEPGTTLGMPFSVGDFSSYTYGTLSYVDGAGNFLTFGHPMMRDGATMLAASRGYIQVTPPNLRRNDKIGVALDIIGSGYQDRGAAVAGSFGGEPPMTEVEVRVLDETTGQNLTYNQHVVQNRNTLPGVVAAAAGSALSSASNYNSESSVSVTWNVAFPGIADDFKRYNQFYLPNASTGSARELLQFLTFALENEHREAFPESVSLTAVVEERRSTFRLGELEIIDRENYAKLDSGDNRRIEQLPEDLETIEKDRSTITLERDEDYRALLEVYPWRGEKFWVTTRLSFPPGVGEGEYKLTYYGGGEYVPTEEQVGENARSRALRALNRRLEPFQPEPAADLQDALSEVAGLPSNGELVSELVWAEEKEELELSESEPRPFFRRRLHLDGAVQGAASVNLRLR